MVMTKKTTDGIMAANKMVVRWGVEFLPSLEAVRKIETETQSSNCPVVSLCNDACVVRRTQEHF